jgi:hypothetical protein
MTYRASADWDLQFSDADALAAVADTLTRATTDPEAGPRARILTALAEVSTIQDIGFDGGSGLHLTGWTGGGLDITRCETVMAALAGQATGTIDWSDEEGVHWRDRLTRDGRWEQYPGIVVYPDGQATDPFIVLEHGRVTNDPTLPVLDLDPLTRDTPDRPGATHLVATLKAAAEACGAVDIAQRCEHWMSAAESSPPEAGAVRVPLLTAVPASSVVAPAANPITTRGRAVSLQ